MKPFKKFLNEEKKFDSVGILLYSDSKFFVVHPTNPLSYKSIQGVGGRIDCDFLQLTVHQWSIPKGAPESNEEPYETARREFEEETGTRLPNVPFEKDLGTVQYRSGKVVRAFLMKGTGSEKFIKSNLITGNYLRGLPENDAGGWFDKFHLETMMHPDQLKFLDRI